jgi:hypothetical protein
VRAPGPRLAPRRLAPLLSFALAASAGLAGAGSVAAAPVPAPTPVRPDVASVLVPSTATATAATATAIQPGSVNRTSINITATYVVNATLAVDTGRLHVMSAMTVRNDSGAGVDRLELEAIAARLGSITITSASVDGSPRTVTVNDQTLILPLGGVLPNGATAQVKIGYWATLRNSLTGSNWLFTRYGGTISLYRWIPWVSLARPFDRPNHGDPFVTPTSPEVYVHLTLDKARVLAAPVGGLSKVASTSWTFTARNVRDVNIVLAPDFTVTQTSINGIAIRAYSRPGGVSGSTLASVAKLALSREATRVGIGYPWTSFTIVETAAGGYGMESPAMVWIPSNTQSVNMTYLVHHEVAHQWFYGLVGNDQQRQPFADEAMADMLARTVLGTLRSSRCATGVLDLGITGYSAACYYEKIYIQGGDVLDSFRRTMGTSRFWSTVADYVHDYSFRLGGTKLLLDRLQAHSPVDLRPTLEARFPHLY